MLATLTFLLGLFATLGAAPEGRWRAQAIAQESHPRFEMREVLEGDSSPGEDVLRISWKGNQLLLGPALDFQPSHVWMKADEMGLPGLGVRLADEGARRLGEWSGTRVHRRVAFLVDGRVRTVIFVRARLAASTVIEGIPADEVEELVERFTRFVPYEVHIVVVDGRTRASLDAATARSLGSGTEVIALGGGRMLARVTNPSNAAILVSAPGFQDGPAWLARGRDTAERALEVSLLPAARVDAVVLDDLGRPLPGVFAGALAARPWGVSFPAWFPQVPPERVDAVSDEHGRVVLEGLRPRAAWHFYVTVGSDEADGYVSWPTGSAPLVPGATHYTTWRTPPMRSVHGRVVDEAERGLAEVRLYLVAETLMAAAFHLPVPAATHVDPGGWALTATTDGDGTFRIDSVPEGRYVLRIQGGESVGAPPLLVEVDAESEKKQHRVIAGRHWIEGRIRAAKEYAGDVLLLLAPLDAPGLTTSMPVRSSSEFRFGPVPSGSYELRIADPEFRSHAARVAAAGATDVELELQRPARVHLWPTVDGAALQTVVVASVTPGGPLGTEFMLDAPAGLPPGAYTVVVRSYDARIGIATVVLAPDEERDLDVPLHPGARVEVELAGMAAARLEVEHAGLLVAELRLVRGLPHELLLPAGPCNFRLASSDGRQVLFERTIELASGPLMRIALQP